MKMRIPLVATVMLVASSCWTYGVRAEDLYSVSFEPPQHQVGGLPSTGGPHAPSQIWRNRPTVRAASGLFTSQYLEFASHINVNPHEEIHFAITSLASKFEIEFDIVLDALPSGVFESISVSLHGDTWHNFFAFRGGGKYGYEFRNASLGAGGGLTNAANLWQEDSLLHVSAVIDLKRPVWHVYVNDVFPVPNRSDLPFRTDIGESLKLIKVAYHHAGINGFSSVGIDNFVIRAVPEPKTQVMLALLGIYAILCRKRVNALREACHA